MSTVLDTQDNHTERVRTMTDTNWTETIYQLLEQEYALYGDIQHVLDAKRQAIIDENLPQIETLDVQLESFSFKAREHEKRRLEKITMCMGEPVSLSIFIQEISEAQTALQFKTLQSNLKERLACIHDLILRNQQLIEQSLEKLNKNIGFWTSLLSQEHPVYASQGTTQKSQEGVSTVMHNA